MRSCIVITLCLSIGLSGCGPDDPQELLQKAVESYRKNPEAAVALATEAAHRGHLPAMFALGQYYSDGHMIDAIAIHGSDSARHNAEANKWYGAAVRELTVRMESGDDAAKHFLAIMHYEGVGTPVNTDYAIEMMADLAIRDDAVAAYWVVDWYADEGRLSEMDELIDELLRREYDFAHRMQAEGMFRSAGARGEPADVVAIVEALAMSGEKGDSIAAANLSGMLSGIEAAAERGVPDAIDSRSALRDAGVLQLE